MFRTVFKADNGKKGSWTVLVADSEQLLFDGEPLFYDQDEKSRHVRPSLHEPEIEPTERHTAGTLEKSLSPLYKGGYTSRQPQKPARGGSRSARSRWQERRPTTAGLHRLRKCAHGITRRRLESLHWDNCRIDHQHDAAAGWVLKRLREGFHEDAIAGAYLAGLRRAHGFAVDLEAAHGSFSMASTLAEATRLLGRDRRCNGERISGFYDRRRRECAALVSMMMNTKDIIQQKTSSNRI